VTPTELTGTLTSLVIASIPDAWVIWHRHQRPPGLEVLVEVYRGTHGETRRHVSAHTWTEDELLLLQTSDVVWAVRNIRQALEKLEDQFRYCDGTRRRL
jgi:hypothetical protein